MKKHLFTAGLAVAALGLLGACASYVQTTSGEDYLARYEETWQPNCAPGEGGIDAEVRAIAAVEPNLVFPARIGLARIADGRLTEIPGDESALWVEMTNGLDAGFGEFVPVSPFIAAMVSSGSGDRLTPKTAIEDIRRGAARQHLDYVLVYEVTSATSKRDNAFSIADATILGFFLLPGRNVKAEAIASGIMLDVRNGYPYATITAFTEEKGVSRGSAAWGRMAELADTAEEGAVAEFVIEVESALKKVLAASETTGS